jgi:hypothetical protein
MHHAHGTAAGRGYSVLLYLVFFVLGVMEGVVGSFHYSHSPVPLVAIFLVVIILATCALCGWGTMTFSGALAPGAGWILASYFLSMSTHAGSVIITNSPAGKWYLYGGTLAVLIGLLGTFTFQLRVKAMPGRPRP